MTTLSRRSDVATPALCWRLCGAQMPLLRTDNDRSFKFCEGWQPRQTPLIGAEDVRSPIGCQSHEPEIVTAALVGDPRLCRCEIRHVPNERRVYVVVAPIVDKHDRAWTLAFDQSERCRESTLIRGR